MKEASILGIDLAKNVFHICEMSSTGKVLNRRRVPRSRLFETVVTRCKGVIAMEACGGAQYWARRFESAGFETRMIAAQFVKPYVKSNKNDVVDAEAICEAASRPQMRFVATRSEEQQDIQNLHRIRERLVKARTGLSNEIRGLLLEYGMVLPQGIGHLRSKLPALLEQERECHSGLWHATFSELYEEFCELDKRIKVYEARLKVIAHGNEHCKRLLAVPGIGVLTATALYAAVGDPSVFTNGRQFAAWLGLTPRQHSTGGKTSLGGISKRGDSYIRKLLVQGGRSMSIAASHKNKREHTLQYTDQWLLRLTERKGSNRAAVAMANKTARRAWVVLMGKEFKQPEELLALAA